MKRIEFRSVGIGVLIGAGAMLGVAATGSTRTTPPWEYQVTTGDAHSGEFRSQMNKFGDWEFVATSGVGERSAYAVFRRPK
jgi:hypothetical protein